MKFTDYAKKHGCVLLKDDYNYLQNIIRKIPPDARKRVLSDYVALWVRSMAECENELLRQNLARRIANTWIRENYGR